MISAQYLKASARILTELRIERCEFVSHLQTHLGYERENQEDAASIANNNICIAGRNVRMHVSLIADGCGGAQCGELASAIAVTLMPAVLITSIRTTPTLEALIESAFRTAHQSILKAGQRNPESEGMASTVAALIVIDDNAYIAWVGDSRVYRHRDGRIELLTRDHSRVQLLVDEGIINEAESKLHPMRNILSKAMGGSREPLPDLVKIDLRPDDLFILTSDGFHEGLSRESFEVHCARHLREHVTAHALKSLAEDLESVALENYGSDNLTAILTYVTPNERDRT